LEAASRRVLGPLTIPAGTATATVCHLYLLSNYSCHCRSLGATTSAANMVRIVPWSSLPTYVAWALVLLFVAALPSVSAGLFTNSKAPSDHAVFSWNKEAHRSVAVGVYTNASVTRQYGLDSTVLVTILTEADLKAPLCKHYVVNLLSQYKALNLKSLLYVDFAAVKTVAKNDVDFYWSLAEQFSKTVFVSDTMRAGSHEPLLSAATKTQLSEQWRSALTRVRVVSDNLLPHGDVIVVKANVIIIRDFVISGLMPFRWTNCSILLVPKVTDCEFPHTQLEPKWEEVQAVDDVLYIRNGSYSSAFLTNWTALIERKDAAGATISSALMKLRGSGVVTYQHPGNVNTRDHLSYAFVSEFQFQAMESIDRCNKEQLYRRGTLAEYEINSFPTKKNACPAMIVEVGDIQQSVLRRLMRSNKLLGIGNGNEKLYVNTVDTTAMNRYILDSAAEEGPDRLNLLSRVEQGSLVALFGQSYIFVYDHGKLRTFPSSDVFLATNFRWHDVRRYDINVVSHFVRGPDVRATDTIERHEPLAVPPKHHSKHPHKKDPNDLTADERLVLLVDMWRGLANSTFDPAREKLVKTVLGRAAGIYTDPARKSRTKELSKTVLINVASIADDLGHDSRYWHMLSNWICYAQQYGYEPITYYVPNSNLTLNTPPKALLEIGMNRSNLMSYPLHLFWKLLSHKRTNIMGGQANYQGDLPSFTNHGAIVMLVPLLEALLAGFNVMYFDLDTLMVHDPVPFMMTGNADFTVQLELRNCFYPSSHYYSTIIDIANWEYFEPNTGIFFVRSTSTGVRLFEQWMEEIVRRNVMNDQKALDFRSLGAKLSFSCNEELHYLENNQTFMSKFMHNSKPNASTYCFLNEFLFQNGKIALGCGRGNGGSKSEYLEDMYRQGVRILNGTPTVSNIPAELRDPLNPVPGLNTPVMLHFNYCDDKVVEYAAYNGWLPKIDENNVSYCSRFDVNTSALGSMDWPEVLRVANMDLHSARNKFQNGSVVRLHRRRSNFLVMDGKLREIPDQETFEALGFKHSDVKSVPAFNFVRLIPAGDEVPSARDPNKTYRYRH
jgi:hypothetical protein